MPAKLKNLPIDVVRRLWLYRRRLGEQGSVRCIVVGIGALGTALARFLTPARCHCEVVAGFDIDESKIGTRLNGAEILPVTKMAEVVEKNKVNVGIIAVPASQAQKAADLMIASGIKAILNFPDVILAVPGTVVKRNIDVCAEMDALSCAIDRG
jgi:redox-sensing transcriptional repressor